MDDDEVICGCLNLTIKDIKNAVKSGARSFEEVQNVTKVGTACGVCIDEVTLLVDKLLEK